LGLDELDQAGPRASEAAPDEVGDGGPGPAEARHRLLRRAGEVALHLGARPVARDVVQDDLAAAHAGAIRGPVVAAHDLEPELSARGGEGQRADRAAALERPAQRGDGADDGPERAEEEERVLLGRQGSVMERQDAPTLDEAHLEPERAAGEGRIA